MSEVFSDEQSVFFVGGRGDKSGRIADAGGCTKAWWDGESDKAAAMAKLMTSTGGPIITLDSCAYTDGNNRITQTDAFDGAEVGMVAYVIETPIPDVDVYTGRYKITAVDPGGDWFECSGIDGSGDTSVNVEIGGAFDALDNACDETSATTHSVWVHTNLAETLASAVTITAGGNNTRNTFKHIIGYNTVPGDMNRGGAYYESPFEMLLAGVIDSAKTVRLNADGGVFENMSISADNVIVENIYLYNNDDLSAAILFAGTPLNIVFRNCRFSDTKFVTKTAADSVLFDSCFAMNISWNHYVIYGRNNVLLNCVSDSLLTGAYFAIPFGADDTQIIGCIATGGAGGVYALSNAVVVVGNTFYDQTGSGVWADNCEAVVVFNNIFVLYPGAVGLRGSVAGSFIYNDYNCFIESDGTPLTVGAHDSGYEAPVAGPHSIEGDPLFVDAANGNFRLAGNSPCIDAGRPDSLGGRSTIGAYDLSANRGVSKARVIGGV